MTEDELTKDTDAAGPGLWSSGTAAQPNLLLLLTAFIVRQSRLINSFLLAATKQLVQLAGVGMEIRTLTGGKLGFLV